ncbi:serine hydroxymethyltransferase [Patescibacteria group bacterium]|nr:serine hydroxymethyltransferase [Patescibacteria group bacterium]
MLEYLSSQDKPMADLIKSELARQQADLQMIPSENFTSLAVMEALGSVLTNKYSEGYPGKRYYGGNHYIDQIENLARQRACQLFGVQHANVQAYSGSPANQAVYFALLKPGDKVMGLELNQGGHLTHGYKLNFSGKYYKPLGYNLNPQTHLLDYDLIRQAALTYKPKLIVCGATAYPRQIDFAAFRKIADEVKAYLLADVSHISGLIISGDHPSPVPYADVVMTTTHKTLRGPRGALILIPNKQDRWHDLYRPKSKKNLAELIDSAIIPGLQGGPHNQQTAAIAVALQEALLPDFQNYGHQIVKNAQALANSLIKNGLELITGGTDNHLILINLNNQGLTGQQAETVLDSVGITVNKNLIPYDSRSPLDPSGIRLGTPALTSRGFKELEMTTIGYLISQTLKSWQNESSLTIIKKQVKELSTQFPLYPELK